MKIREHRGSLDQSLATVAEIAPTREALTAHIQAVLGQWLIVLPSQIHIEPYTYDARIDWNTHIVTIDDYGVFGFTDGPLKDTP